MSLESHFPIRASTDVTQDITQGSQRFRVQKYCICLLLLCNWVSLESHFRNLGFYRPDPAYYKSFSKTPRSKTYCIFCPFDGPGYPRKAVFAIWGFTDLTQDITKGSQRPREQTNNIFLASLLASGFPGKLFSQFGHLQTWPRIFQKVSKDTRSKTFMYLIAFPMDLGVPGKPFSQFGPLQT